MSERAKQLWAQFAFLVHEHNVNLHEHPCPVANRLSRAIPALWAPIIPDQTRKEGGAGTRGRGVLYRGLRLSLAAKSLPTMS